MKILTVVGARPQIIKAAVLSSEFARSGSFDEILVHTGQHYDYEMSQVFFDELEMKTPDYNLGVGSATHAMQTAEIMRRLEPVVQRARPDVVLVYGDTNSTLAGSLVAAKLGVPVAHVEAGLRSFNRTMPEEINRIVADHVSDILFAPNSSAAAQLEREGILGRIAVVGDLMVDLVFKTVNALPSRPPILDRFELASKAYAVATLHRASNTDDRQRFHRIIRGLRNLTMPVIFPIHPRAADLANELNVGDKNDNIIKCAPLSYVDMVALQFHARVILTDSGGMQKEAACLRVPCVTLRDETEWPETLELGWNALAGSDPDAIQALALRPVPRNVCPAYRTTGDCAARIVATLLDTAQNAPMSQAAGGMKAWG